MFCSDNNKSKFAILFVLHSYFNIRNIYKQQILIEEAEYLRFLNRKQLSNNEFQTCCCGCVDGYVDG